MLYIDGRWINSRSDTFEVHSPVDGRKLGLIPIASSEDVKSALEAAKSAFPRWSQVTKHERSKLFVEFGRQLETIVEDASTSMALEMGKPVPLAREELTLSVKTAYQTAVEIKRYETSYLSCEDPNVRGYTQIEPYGVFAIITPWNFPILNPLFLLCSSIAAGNTVVFKPAEQSPISGQKIVECFDRAGFPKGVVNLVQGPGEITGEALTTSDKLDGIGFTGSIETGKRIATKQAGKLVHLVFELGGNGPIVVLEDADLAAAATAISQSCFSNSGQDCQAGERIIVHESVYTKLSDRLVEETKRWLLGNPLDAGVAMGPLVDENIASKVDSHVFDATEKGAKIRTGGKRAPGFPTNLYYESTVIEDVTPDMLVARQESFGPLSPLIQVSTVDEALEMANSGDYGLAASIFTKDLKKGIRLAETIRTGTVMVNYPSVFFDLNAPFGGMRKSGLDRLFGKYGIASMSQLKTVFLNVG